MQIKDNKQSQNYSMVKIVNINTHMNIYTVWLLDVTSHSSDANLIQLNNLLFKISNDITLLLYTF